jgi:3-mercaptopyruvate sulfurtransferase SseA
MTKVLITGRRPASSRDGLKYQLKRNAVNGSKIMDEKWRKYACIRCRTPQRFHNPIDENGHTPGADDLPSSQHSSHCQ